jgi:GNAT superfamily N-acetyltransferase
MPHDDLKVWVGKPEDIDDMMELALLACAENGFVDPNPLRLLGELWPALNREKGIVGMVGVPGEKLQGAILLRIGQIWYSDQEILEERAVFIHPEYRAAKGGRARKLCDFSKKVADELGLPLTIGVLSNQRTSGKIRMYERMFGAPAGAYFLYGTRTGAAQAAE